MFPNAIPGDKKDAALEKLRQKVESNSAVSGVMVLDGGADWKSFSFSSKDAEFLDSRKLNNLDICRIWGVPPTAAGITDNATYSNSDQESRALVVRCLAPMAKRLEQAMNAALLTDTSRQTLFIEHDLAGLLRGDMKARYESYRIGREWGWLSPNEIRGWENMPEIENGDEYLSPLNMTIVGDRQPDNNHRGRVMGYPKAVIKQSDAKRLFRAALEAGFSAAKIIVHPDGRIEASGSLAEQAASSDTANTWDDLKR